MRQVCLSQRRPRRYSARLANDLSVEFDSSDRRGTGLPYAIVLGNGDVSPWKWQGQNGAIFFSGTNLTSRNFFLFLFNHHIYFPAQLVGKKMCVCFCCGYRFYFPAQLVGDFTLSGLLDKPRSQVSSLLPPGINMPPFLSCTRCSIPTARRLNRTFLLSSKRCFRLLVSCMNYGVYWSGSVYDLAIFDKNY